MEILLAIVVASAVIFFGALISMGNERQRKAIDGLREQVVLWAIQDLKIKREHLAQTVQVPDPVEWLNKTVSKVCGYDLKLQILETFEEPQSLVCTSGDNSARIIFSPLSPSEVHRILKGKSGRLGKYNIKNPLLSLPRDTKHYELSSINCGIMFDLEMQIAWNELSGSKLETTNLIWVYLIS